MNKWLALTLMVAGAATLQGCAYDPNAGTYGPAAGYGYGYPAYGYPSYGYPAYAPSYGGSVAIGGVWGSGYRGGYWDHRYHEEHEGHGHREGGNRPEHPGAEHPINLGINYHPPHPEGGYQHSPPPGGHADHDHDRDRDRDHH